MNQSGFSLKTQQILATVLTLTVGCISLSAMVHRDLIAEQQVAAGAIDFAALHRQASDALDRLHRSGPPGADAF
jgi:hypothetical protein